VIVKKDGLNRKVLDFGDVSIEYWFPLFDKAKKTMGYDAAGEKISYNPEGCVGCDVVTGLNVSYAFWCEAYLPVNRKIIFKKLSTPMFTC
jgi:hypothetical protein